MRKYLIGAAAVSAIATPAFAQEAAPFSGGHIEVLTGLDNVSVDGDGATGLAYGLGLGFDGQSGGTVYGIEGEIADSTTKECDAGVCVKTGRDLYVGGRLGFVTGANTMFYGKVGYTNAQARLTAGGTTIDKENLDGIRAGVGVETRLGGNLSLRGEYRYSNYENDVVRHQGLIGLGFRF